ncbi:gluconate 2-dehydrogenase subunit 3 family protein [Dyadobacter tibetensis]|uniref:gluconate 2-dehydrogenase subunit 3 family protein n=1 Tax=Dyadobacter tibetensis TaxID=1211851 RepID=UPI000470F8EB|nr:gluconate 2-dehydrogenase subunit 3 family protein [Dyadobacter tibetensis]
MKRRDSLRALTLSSLGLAAINPQVGLAEQRKLDSSPSLPNEDLVIPGGRTKEEAIRDARLMKEEFLTKEELATIAVLSDIIIPADEKSGSATSAGVPEFIAFIAKDMPQHQVPLRGGLRWLDRESNKRFEKNFTALTHKQRINIVDDIAYPEKAKPQFSQGVAFFTLMRNLTASGFYTSKIGIDDIGYVGNTPNVWTGPPADVIKQYEKYIK